MSILIDEKTPIIVQGFTGDKASFHADEMIKYGSNVVGGVTPGKGGMTHLERPVFNTVKDAVRETQATASLAFVPPTYAADALMEAADAGLKLVCIITDGIPSQDMMRVKSEIDSVQFVKDEIDDIRDSLDRLEADGERRKAKLSDQV